MRGFSLVETLVIIFITGVMGVAINTMISSFYKDDGYLVQQTSAIDSAQRGIQNAFIDLREASYGDDGSYPILSAGTSTITFFSDVDGNGLVDKVHIYLLGTTLYRGVTKSTSSPPVYTGQPEATSTIATYVRNATTSPVFRYYDTNGVELPGTTTIDVSKIESITTVLLVDLNPFRAPAILNLQETATLRNLRQ